MEMKYLLLHTKQSLSLSHTHMHIYELPSNIRFSISLVAFVLRALQQFRLEIPNI